MISAISALPQYADESLYTTGEKDELGRDSFMKLFLAQMNHQDPLNPMDTENFGAQLAQFSTLEQLYNANETLESIEGIQGGDTKYNALDLMGKDIQAQSDTIVLGEKTDAEGAFYLDTAAESCVVRVYDENGKTVKDIAIEKPFAGIHSFKWDGRDENGNRLEKGLYSFNVSAVSPEGDQLSVERYVEGTVTRVSLYEEEPVIYVNDIPMSMEQIVNIKMPEAEDSAGSDTEAEG